MFQPSNFLLKSLNAEPKDMEMIVGALVGYINGDPGFETEGFDNAVDYVLTHGVQRDELFVPYDPQKQIEEDNTKWDKKYFIQEIVYLQDNFCEKRIAHIKAVANKLYPKTNASNNANETSRVSAPETMHQSNTRNIAPKAETRENQISKKAQGQQYQKRSSTTTQVRKSANGGCLGTVLFVLLAIVVVSIIIF